MSSQLPGIYFWAVCALRNSFGTVPCSEEWICLLFWELSKPSYFMCFSSPYSHPRSHTSSFYCFQLPACTLFEPRLCLLDSSRNGFWFGWRSFQAEAPFWISETTLIRSCCASSEWKHPLLESTPASRLRDRWRCATFPCTSGRGAPEERARWPPSFGYQTVPPSGEGSYLPP